MNAPINMPNSISTLKQQLQQLKELNAAGALPSAQYEESKALLERRLVDAVLQSGSAEQAGAAAIPLGVPAGPATADSPSAAAEQPARKAVSGTLMAVLAACVVAIAGAGYWWKGSPEQISSANAVQGGAAGTQDGGAGAPPHATGSDQIAAMAEKLAVRLKDAPNDAEGWAMLARSYTVLGRFDDALKAYERAVAQRGDDAQLLADYADTLAVKNDRTLAGEPMKLVEKALKLDPRNVKALALAGSAAFDRKDYTAAVRNWEQVIEVSPPDSPFVGQVQASLVEARALGGMPPGGKVSEKGASPVALSGKTVGGTVTLAPALVKQAAPDDTLFIFARAAAGRGMPLAILSKKVRDLPVKFSLDDSLSMSPAALLSAAGTVVVGARISKSGNAMPQDGDLAGQTEPVALGSTNLKIEIRDIVKR